jgi:hypothetical protein
MQFDRSRERGGGRCCMSTNDCTLNSSTLNYKIFGHSSSNEGRTTVQKASCLVPLLSPLSLADAEVAGRRPLTRAPCTCREALDPSWVWFPVLWWLLTLGFADWRANPHQRKVDSFCSEAS